MENPISVTVPVVVMPKHRVIQFYRNFKKSEPYNAFGVFRNYSRIFDKIYHVFKDTDEFS